MALRALRPIQVSSGQFTPAVRTAVQVRMIPTSYGYARCRQCGWSLSWFYRGGTAFAPMRQGWNTPAETYAVVTGGGTILRSGLCSGCAESERERLDRDLFSGS